jgi:pimeloyl-ACP methyl ester carboxylesterase
MLAILPIFEAQGPKRANVILFHGLNGDARTSWRAKQKGEIDEHFWPAWLAADIEDLSVYSVSYAAPISDFEGRSPHYFSETWEIFDLLLKTPALRTGPLILIGHSLGGLVIKELIRTAEGYALTRPEAEQFLARVEKIVFLATPHRGANFAGWGDVVNPGIRQSQTAEHLEPNHPQLCDLYRWYCNWANSREIAHLSMYETKPAGLLGTIVEADSANPGLKDGKFLPAQNCDHFEIAQPEGINSPVYKCVSGFLKSPAKSVSPPTGVEAKTCVTEGALLAA